MEYVDNDTYACSGSPKVYKRDVSKEVLVCCAFRGWPLPRIIWRKIFPDAELIVNGSHGFTLSEKLQRDDTLRSFLRLSKPKEKHEGEYECIAENSTPGWPSPESVKFELRLDCELGPEGTFPIMVREGIPYKGLYGVALPDMGTFFRLEVFQMVENLGLKYIKGFIENLPFKYF